MISLLFLANVIALLFVEGFLLTRAFGMTHTTAWRTALAAFNVVLIIQLTPLFAPGPVLQLLDGPEIAKHEAYVLGLHDRYFQTRIRRPWLMGTVVLGYRLALTNDGRPEKFVASVQVASMLLVPTLGDDNQFIPAGYVTLKTYE